MPNLTMAVFDLTMYILAKHMLSWAHPNSYRAQAFTTRSLRGAQTIGSHMVQSYRSILCAAKNKNATK